MTKRKNVQVRERKATGTKWSDLKPEAEGDQRSDEAPKPTRIYPAIAVVLLVATVGFYAWTVPRRTPKVSNVAPSNVEVSCTPMNDEVVERRSNLSMEEFVRCYDGKRYALDSF